MSDQDVRIVLTVIGLIILMPLLRSLYDAIGRRSDETEDGSVTKVEKK